MFNLIHTKKSRRKQPRAFHIRDTVRRRIATCFFTFTSALSLVFPLRLPHALAGADEVVARLVVNVMLLGIDCQRPPKCGFRIVHTA